MKNYVKRTLAKHLPGVYSKIRQFRYEKYVLPVEFMKHVKKLSPSDLTIDVGANVGLVSECIARRGVRVIAFEPNSSAFSKLQIVAKKYPNIEPRNEAAGVNNQETKLYLHRNVASTTEDLTQASSLLDGKPNVSRENFELINEVDFSEFLRALNEPVELIKIDIEGYEIQLLNHLLDTKMVDKVGAFYVETHERKFKELVPATQALKARVRAEGYEEKFFFDWH
ncbi:FkbM family methyltransferase [Thalassospira indica]|uniref:FkbM family methyltransferase n=1 Tax=Thalassospira indica TaxID=1891279 RepID=A0ABM6XXB1_9PROT|nr:FkbM family methyltransferase [Thalassospira indica]AXO14268.1 FkbM family methyltransferase [Thalassospira indica]OAZ09210.1 hypothetical protein TH15_20295 [Thalassospira profundimaris]